MARIKQTRGLMEHIRLKAQINAMENGSYGTRARFEPGKVIVTLETVLSREPAFFAGR